MAQAMKTLGDTSWFEHDRFGIFIHWGLYSLAARHEWIKQFEKMPDSKYDRYFRRFDPDLYDPDEWAAAAAGAGMKYFVITTKHHEGFCLWDSDLTDYKATNTPAGRDLLKPMVEAFRNRNMKTGFYHSLLDWRHPDFVIDDLHSLRDSPDRAKLNKPRNQARYIKYLHGQTRELLTNFGRVDLMWFDFSYPASPNRAKWQGKGAADWNSKALHKMVRELQPHILLNDRMDLPGSWDIKTPEQIQPRSRIMVDGKPVTWEACQTFSGSWGYHRDESSWKSVEQLIHMLIDTVSKAGNLLLNVGPTARGEFDERALDRLKGIGEWMKRHSRSIYGCTQAPPKFKTPEDCRLTYNPKTRRLYVHVFAWPFIELHLDGKAFVEQVEYAQLLNDASEILLEPRPEWQSRAEPVGKSTLTLRLPVQKPDVAVPVIELFLK